MKKSELKNDIYNQLYQWGTKKSDLRRREIAEAAVSCIAEHGLESAIFDRISEVLSIRRSHLHYYYKTREDLLEAATKVVVTRAQSITINLISEADSPIEQLLSMGEAALAWAKQNPNDVKLIFTFYSYATVQARFTKMQTAIRRAGNQRIALLVQSISPTSTPETVQSQAKIIQAFITGLMIEQMTGVEWKKSHRGQMLLMREGILNLLGRPQ